MQTNLAPVPKPVHTIALLQGQQIPEAPYYFRCVMRVLCEDGTTYAAGYNVNQHPNGVPDFALTFRRISLKRGEQRRINKLAKSLEGTVLEGLDGKVPYPPQKVVSE